MHMPIQPTEREEEYFARLEFERLQKAEHERQQKLAADEKKRLKELHYMQCPKCGMKLVEIDKCTECDGVWLDAGELEAVAKLDKSRTEKFFSVFKK